MSTFGDVSYPRGVQDYRCEWCGETIPKDARHPHFVGMWHGAFQNWRMHSECYEAAGENEYLVNGFTPYDHERPIAPPQEQP